uniref:DNK domain-containing protein n=1 Tax=Panagrellus redivivus TaxID=6233 RepID=A0A7E4W7R5_PANRE
MVSRNGKAKKENDHNRSKQTVKSLLLSIAYKHTPRRSGVGPGYTSTDRNRKEGPGVDGRNHSSVITVDGFVQKTKRHERAMAGRLSLLRGGVMPRLASGGFSLVGVDRQQKRTIVNRTLLKLPEDYPEPWDYKTKGFTKLDAITDGTQARLHQNSKLIVVEGNLGSGKSTVAKELADALGFLHMPAFKIEDLLVDRYGNNFKDFYPQFPKPYRVPTLDLFYKDPSSDLTAVMQDRVFVSRFEQYLNACAHILNTGQGVVLERSVYSDFVFANALRSKNFIGNEYFKHYYFTRKRALPHLRFWPHAVIYLDAPVEKCLDTIKKRGNPDEISVVDGQFLASIKESYKDSIREFTKHSKVLTYDWSKPGDTDTIVEDLERIDFDFFEWHSGDVFETWNTIVDEVGWAGWRQYVTHKLDALSLAFGGIRTHEVSELYTSPRDEGHFLNVLKTQVYKSRFGPGYNTHLGDDSLSGADVIQPSQSLPEPWWDYYYRENWLHRFLPHEALMDPDANAYNPDYLHHH